MRCVFFTLTLIFVLGCSPGSQFQTKTYVKDPTRLSEKIDLNKIKIVCMDEYCPESLALFVTVYNFKTQKPNLKPYTYQASKTCNASVIENKNSKHFELFTSGHCSHKEDDIKNFKNEYPKLNNYDFQSRNHYLYIYNQKLEDTLKIRLNEPDWNYYNPKQLFSLDIMKFTLNQELFSDLKLASSESLPLEADLFTLRRDSGSKYMIKKQSCKILNGTSDFTVEIKGCLILGGDSGAPLIHKGEIYGFISHTNNNTLGGQFVPSHCIANDSCSSP